jgi:dTDP-4-dehydrorhamnose 3,5-epimerase
MKVTPTDLPEVLILEPRVFGDARGFFMESWNQRVFDEATQATEAAGGSPYTFVQDNHSRSARGVLRGLHFQRPPHAQGKLVRVAAGAIFDVAVDIRRSSPRFGRWVGVELSADNHRQLWIPPGFAHGFAVLSDSADVLYKTTDYHVPDCEGAIRWDDPRLNIHWPTLDREPILSAKDAQADGFDLAQAKALLFD